MPLTNSAPDEQVRAAVAAADRRRRRRNASVRLWRTAPIVSGAVLILTLLARWRGAPRALPYALLAVGALILLVDLVRLGLFRLPAIRPRREDPFPDNVAAAIDADAGLGGELRSASWFASRPRQDPWSELHVSRAADRLQGIDWSQFYPRPRVMRSRLVTLALVAATIVLAIVIPERTGLSPAAHAVARERIVRPSREPLQVLSPELLEQLEELLVAAEAGTLPSTTGQPTRELLEKLSGLRDAKSLKELARGMNANADDEEDDIRELRELADRLRHAAEANKPQSEFSKALEELARKLSDTADQEEARERGGQRGKPSEARTGEGAETSDAGRLDAAEIQSMKEAQAAAGAAGVVSMSEKDAAPGAAAPGFGLGGSGGMATDGEMAALDSALRQETVQAARDSGGANVQTEVRRKTEQGQATVTFTHGATTKADTRPTAGPPAVPESRRPDVQRYFIRKQ